MINKVKNYVIPNSTENILKKLHQIARHFQMLSALGMPNPLMTFFYKKCNSYFLVMLVLAFASCTWWSSQ